MDVDTKSTMMDAKNDSLDAEVFSSAEVNLSITAIKKKFSFVSMMGVCLSLMATWEAMSSVFASGLIEGGPVSLLYGYILAFLGTLATCTSLAEIASAYPSPGGQYHWVSHLAPSPISAFMSWVTGWIMVLGWQTMTASASFLAGTMIQGLLVLNYPDYGYERWHGTMIYWALILIAVFINTVAVKFLPKLETSILVLHVALFFVILIAMVATSPHGSAEYVFTKFENSSGWKSDGIAWCIGLLSATYVLVGYDGACHLSDEVENAPVLVPYAMIGTVIINGVLGLGFLIALLFCLGNVDSLLETTTGYPIIQLFYNSTSSRAAASAMTSAIIIMASLATISLLCSASRVLWAFSRDGGLPFSKYFSHVDERTSLPLRSIVLSAIVTMAFGFINIGSTAAFNAIISLAVVGLYVSYTIPLILLVILRIKGKSLPHAPFSLGRMGLPTNILAIIFSVFSSVFLLFPPYQPVTALNMNYGSAVFGGVIVFSIFWWFVRGRKTYLGPQLNLDGIVPTK